MHGVGASLRLPQAAYNVAGWLVFGRDACAHKGQHMHTCLPTYPPAWKVEGLLLEWEKANEALKRALQAITRRERQPSPPYEAARHRAVMDKHGEKASAGLCRMLSRRLREMDAADAALLKAMRSEGQSGDGLKDVLLMHGPKSSPSLEARARALLDEVDPSRRAAEQVENALGQIERRRVRRHSQRRSSAALVPLPTRESSPQKTSKLVVNHEVPQLERVSCRVDDPNPHPIPYSIPHPIPDPVPNPIPDPNPNPETLTLTLTLRP